MHGPMNIKCTKCICGKVNTHLPLHSKYANILVQDRAQMGVICVNGFSKLHTLQIRKSARNGEITYTYYELTL